MIETSGALGPCPAPYCSRPFQHSSRASVVACAAPRVSRPSLKQFSAAPGVVLQLAAPCTSSAAPSAAAVVQPQADVPAASSSSSTGSSSANSTSAGSNSWELVYARPTLQPPPLRRLTAAPATVAGQAGSDPRLVRLTQQLIACSGRPADMQSALERQALAPADVRRLLTYLDRQGAADVALQAFHAMKALPQLDTDGAVLRTKLIKMHSRRPKDTAAALLLYDEMRTDGVEPDAVCYNTALGAAGLGRHWGRVLSILDDMAAAGVRWDAFTCSALLSACSACGQWEQALSWCRQAQEVPGLQLNVVHYTTLMSCLQKAGQWEKSMEVFKQMELAGIEPDVVAHNAAIAACAKGGDWEKAWAVFLSMKQAGLEPSAVSYNALISACERCGQADRALEVFDRMERKQVPPNAVTFNTIISACAKAGLYARAQELHAQMQEAGVADDVFTLTALITACERIGHWQGAEQHFLDFRARGIQPNTVAYNRLISVLGRGGQWEQALVAFNSMLLAGPAVAAGAGSGSPAARSSGGGAPRSGGEGGSKAGVSRQRGPARETGSRPAAAAADALHPFADALRVSIANRSSSSSGDATHGSSLSAEARGSSGILDSSSSSAADGFDDSEAPPPVVYPRSTCAVPDLITYGSLIAALERGGQWQRALAVFEEMRARGIEPNGYIYTSLLNACEKGGQWETAVQLFNELKRRQDIPLDSMAMVARKALYAFPSLVKLTPAPLLTAARATVDSGRAARQWIEKQRDDSQA